MGDVIDFAEIATRQTENATTALHRDPYYRFIHRAIVTANAYGFKLPFTIDTATEHVYRKTRDSSELARLLCHKRR